MKPFRLLPMRVRELEDSGDELAQLAREQKQAEQRRRLLEATRKRLPESLLAVSYVTGWFLLTWGLARLLVFEVWLLSGGLFLLSLGGLGLLKDIAVEGLYVLTRPTKAGERG